MKVTDAMTPREEIVTVSIPGSRNDALEHLRPGAFSAVAVVKEVDGTEVFRGLVSREALIERPDEDQLALLVEEVPTTTADATLEELCALMRETGTRRVPVVDGDELVGIVTVTDVIAALAAGKVETEATVESLAGDVINTVYQGTPLAVCDRQLSYARVPYALVLGDDRDVVGIITEVDLIEVAEVVEGEDAAGESIADEDDDWMWEGIKAVGNRYVPTRNVEFPAAPVAEHMSTDLITVTRNVSAQEAARLMQTNDIEQIPYMRAGKLAGVLQDEDLLEAL